MSSSATGSSKYRTYRDPDTEARLEVEALRAILPDKIDAVMASFRHDRLHVVTSEVEQSVLDKKPESHLVETSALAAQNTPAQFVPPTGLTQANQTDSQATGWPVRIMWGGVAVMLGAAISLGLSYCKSPVDQSIPNRVQDDSVAAGISSATALTPSPADVTLSTLENPTAKAAKPVGKPDKKPLVAKKPPRTTQRQPSSKVERFSEDITPLLRN